MRTKDENKVNQIYKATLKLVSQVGIAGVSIAAIAREAGIGIGSFYTYFTSKEELLNTLFRETRRMYSARLFADYMADEPIKIAMKKIWINYIQYRMELYEHGIFQDQFAYSPYMQGNEDMRQFSMQMMAPLYELLERGKRELIIKDVDNKIIGLMLRGFVHELAQLIRLKQPDDTAYFTDTAFNLFWDAVRN